MDRVEQNSNGEVLSKTWRDTSGNIVDPGTVTITLTRSDGTVLVSGAATSGGGAAARTFTLTTTHTTLLDTLKVVWTSSVYGPRTPEYVEVVGGFLFTVAEARALKPLDSVTNYPTASLIDMRTRVEQALEDACAVAFVPRYERETVSGDGTTLMLKWPKIRAIRSAAVTVSGVATALGSTDLAALSFDTNGILTGYTWTAGTGNVVVGYEHGWDRPPERIRRAALILARSWLVAGPIDDRAATYNIADGGTYSLVVPGRNGSIMGLPEVDAAIQQYSLQVGVA